MASLQIEIPESILSQIKLPPKHAKRMIMEEMVIRLFQQEIITAAHGARLLNMDRLKFEQFLAENETPIHGEPNELDADAKNLERVL